MDSEDEEYDIVELKEKIEDLECSLDSLFTRVQEKEALIQSIVEFIEEKKLTQALLLFLMKKHKEALLFLTLENNDDPIPF